MSAAKIATGSNDRMTSQLSTTTPRVYSQRGMERRRKSRKKSRRKQRRTKSPLTLNVTGTGKTITSSLTHMTDEITTPTTAGSSTVYNWNKILSERRPLNRKSTTERDGNTGSSYVTLSVYLSPIATAVPYVNIGAEMRNDHVTSGEHAWSESRASVATVIGLATVSVFAFWLVVTVIVLSCLLARRTKPRNGCVVDSRWSWSGNQLIGLLDDGVLDAPPENTRLYATEPYDVDVSPPRWNSTSDDADRKSMEYRFAQRRTWNDDDEFRPKHQTELLDSGYDTLAVTVPAPETEMYETPEVTPEIEVWTRQPAASCSQQRPGNVDVRCKLLTPSQRRFPRMGQSCLYRAAPCRPFIETATSRRGEDDGSRRRLTGYTALPRSNTATDIGTTAV